MAQTSYARQQALLKIGGTAQQNVDQAKAGLGTANAQIGSLRQQAEVQLAKLGGAMGLPLESHPEYLQAQAAFDEAQRQLDHTVVRAPFDGVVTQVSSLQPGAMIVSLARGLHADERGRTCLHQRQMGDQANLKETDLTYVHAGQPVDISIDTFPGHTFHGTVSSDCAGDGCDLFRAAGAE